MNLRIVLVCLGLVATSLAGPVLYPESVPSMAEVHGKAVAWFVSRPGMGLARVVPPEFYQPLSAEIVSIHGEKYRVKEMQLLGILKHDPPVAYLIGERFLMSPHQFGEGFMPKPTEEAFKDHPSRPLTPTEQKAISAMKSDSRKDIVPLESTSNSTRIVGSIRAMTSCLECHDVQKDDLLGAFSYTLERLPGDSVPVRGTADKP
jgi:hypothetical protein